MELERTARRSFLREKQLIRSKASIAVKNSELSKLNSDLENSQAEMQTKTSALVTIKEEMRQRAERDNLNKSRFLAEAAHDLRQPMQALSNYLEVAQHAAGSQDFDKCISILELAQSALRITRVSFAAVLEISRLESGFVKAEYTNFDVQELLEEVASPDQVENTPANYRHASGSQE